MTFEAALSEALGEGVSGGLRRAGSPIVWQAATWPPGTRYIYARVALAGGFCKAPISLATEDLTATDWEMVAPQ